MCVCVIIFAHVFVYMNMYIHVYLYTCVYIYVCVFAYFIYCCISSTCHNACYTVDTNTCRMNEEIYISQGPSRKDMKRMVC